MSYPTDFFTRMFKNDLETLKVEYDEGEQMINLNSEEAMRTIFEIRSGIKCFISTIDGDDKCFMSVYDNNMGLAPEVHINRYNENLKYNGKLSEYNIVRYKTYKSQCDVINTLLMMKNKRDLINDWDWELDKVNEISLQEAEKALIDKFGKNVKIKLQ